MEKKYLEIITKGRKIGAFENVKNVVVEENKVTFDGDEGHIEFTKKDGNWEVSDNYGNKLTFDSYRVVGRRTVKRDLEKSYLESVKER